MLLFAGPMSVFLSSGADCGTKFNPSGPSPGSLIGDDPSQLLLVTYRSLHASNCALVAAYSGQLPNSGSQ